MHLDPLVLDHWPAAPVYLAGNNNAKIDWAAIFLCLGGDFGCLETLGDYLNISKVVRRIAVCFKVDKVEIELQMP